MKSFELTRISISVIVILLLWNLISFTQTSAQMNTSLSQNLFGKSNESNITSSGLDSFTSDRALLNNSSQRENDSLIKNSRVPSGAVVAVPVPGGQIQLQVTKRQGNTVIIGPGELGLSRVHCNSDEVMTGGGFASSSPGIRIKDAAVNNREGFPDEVAEGDVQMSDMLEYAVRGYNPDLPGYTNVSLFAEVYCAKLIVR